MQAGQEGYVGGLNVSTLLAEMLGEDWLLHLVIDNQAAVQLLTTQGPTSWRTKNPTTSKRWWLTQSGHAGLDVGRRSLLPPPGTD